MPRGKKSPTKTENEGAFTVRPPKETDDRALFLKLKDHAADEFRQNRALKNGGPTSLPQLVFEMLKDRYRQFLNLAEDEEARVAAEQGKGEPPASVEDLFG